MKQIFIQPRGEIVLHWHFAHYGCDCYDFIDYKSKQLQWEPTKLACSGALTVTEKQFVNSLQAIWPDHTISFILHTPKTE